MATLSQVQQRAEAWVSTLPVLSRFGLNWRFVSNVTVLSGGSALAQGFNIAFAPVITRLFTPAEIGILGLFTAFLTVASVGASLRYEFGIVSAKDEQEASYLLIASFLFALPVAAISAAVMYALTRWSLIGFGGLPRHAALLMVPAMFFAGVFAALRYWSLREERFGLASHGTVVQNAGRSISQTGLGFLGLHAAGLLLGEVIGRCLGMTKMFRAAWPAVKRQVWPVRWSVLRRTLGGENRKFPIYSLPSSLLDAIAASISVPLLIRLYGNDIGGHYTLVWRVTAVPYVLITTAVADAFHSRMAICARETPHRVLPLFMRTALALTVIAAIPSGVLMLWGVPLFKLVFGSRWALSGTIAAIVAPWYLLQFVVNPLSRLVLVLSGQEFKLVYDVASVVAVLGVFYVAGAHGYDVLHTIRLLTVAKVLTYALFFLVLLRVAVRGPREATQRGITPA